MFLKITTVPQNAADQASRFPVTLRASSVLSVADLTKSSEEVRARFGAARSTILIRESVENPIYSTDHASQIETALIEALDNDRVSVVDISSAADFDDPDAPATAKVVVDIETTGGPTFTMDRELPVRRI